MGIENLSAQDLRIWQRTTEHCPVADIAKELGITSAIVHRLRRRLVHELGLTDKPGSEPRKLILAAQDWLTK